MNDQDRYLIRALTYANLALVYQMADNFEAAAKYAAESLDFAELADEVSKMGEPKGGDH